MSEHPCHACGRRAGESPSERPPCELPDPAAEPKYAGDEWSPLFGRTATYSRPQLACPAGLRQRSRAAFLAGRNERRAELRTDRRKRP